MSKIVWFGVISSIVIAGMVGITFARNVIKKKLSEKKSKSSELSGEDVLQPPKSGSGIDELEHYINKARENAMGDKEIGQALNAHGWSKDVIAAFLRGKKK